MTQRECVQSSERKEIEQRHAFIGELGDIARAVDDEDRHFREAFVQNGFQVRHKRRFGVVDDDDKALCVLLQGQYRLDGWHQVSGRLEAQRDDADGGRFCSLDDARFNPASKVDDDAFRRIAYEDGRQRLTRFQDFNGALWQGCLIDLGSAVLKVVGDEKRLGVAGVSDGVRRLTLAALDRIEEHAHGNGS